MELQKIMGMPMIMPIPDSEIKMPTMIPKSETPLHAAGEVRSLKATSKNTSRPMRPVTTSAGVESSFITGIVVERSSRFLFVFAGASLQVFKAHGNIG
jgi:hypothetical protein